MKIIEYENKYYNEIKDFVKNEIEQGILPEKLGGTGLFIRELRGNKISAFIWALTSSDSEIACIDYFGVSKEKRGNGVHGPLIFAHLLKVLDKKGIKTVIGFIKKGANYSEMLLNIYKRMGAEINEGHTFLGNIKDIFENIKHWSN